jgi:hypothetical protein
MKFIIYIITYYHNMYVHSVCMGVVCVFAWFNVEWLGFEYRLVAWELGGRGSWWWINMSNMDYWAMDYLEDLKRFKELFLTRSS